MPGNQTDGGATIAHVPLYEFECGRCGARFEELAGAGTETSECRQCGAVGATRVYSAPGAPFRLVKMGGELRKQERKNAELRADAKARFRSARSRARGAGEGRTS
jgi:putative FmdB family regulatory protein